VTRAPHGRDVFPPDPAVVQRRRHQRSVEPGMSEVLEIACRSDPAAGEEAVVISGGFVSIAKACPPARAKLTPGRSGMRVKAAWRACSGLAVVVAVPFGISTVKGMLAIGSAELGMTGTWRFLITGMGILASGAMLLQVYNVVVLNAFWAFFTTIVVQLIAGIIQFVRLILLPLRQTT